MHRDRWKTVVAAMLVWWFVPAGESRAQGVGLALISPEYDRALAPGAVVPYQQYPFAHRYGFDGGQAFAVTFGRSNAKLEYLEYIDRVERAEKFGYRIPAPPCGWAPVFSRPRCP
jgi:hypothetical protein